MVVDVAEVLGAVIAMISAPFEQNRKTVTARHHSIAETRDSGFFQEEFGILPYKNVYVRTADQAGLFALRRELRQVAATKS